MKKLALVLTMLMMMVVLLSGCGSSKTENPAKTNTKETASSGDVIEIKLGMVDPEGSNFHKGALAIAEEVKKATKGKINISVYAGAQLGNERDMYEGAQMGTIDMFTASNAVLTNFIPEMAVLDRPFIFETTEQAHKVIDGKMGQMIAKKTNDQGIQTVGWMDVGFRNVFSSRPVKTIDDFKGLKIRTMENDIHIAAFNALGAIATPMASSEVFTALQQHTIDAAENAVANLIANKYYEITKNVTMTNHVFGFMGVFMSNKVWEKIPKDMRGTFLTAVKAGCERQRKYLVNANEDAVKKLKTLNVNIYTIDMKLLRDKVEPSMEKFSGKMNPDWVAALNEGK